MLSNIFVQIRYEKSISAESSSVCQTITSRHETDIDAKDVARKQATKKTQDKNYHKVEE